MSWGKKRLFSLSVPKSLESSLTLRGPLPQLGRPLWNKKTFPPRFFYLIIKKEFFFILFRLIEKMGSKEEEKVHTKAWIATWIAEPVAVSFTTVSLKIEGKWLRKFSIDSLFLLLLTLWTQTITLK